MREMQKTEREVLPSCPCGAPEEWRVIDGYPEYEVSDHGRVQRLVEGSWELLPTGPPGSGYRMVNLNGDTKAVHVLVLTAFVGPRPEGMEACHDPDPDPANNHLTNLRWDTHAGNGADYSRHRTARNKARENKRSLERIKVLQGAKILDGFCRLSELAKDNPHLFPNLRALQDFTERNREELLRRKALIKLGPTRTSRILLHAKRLEQMLTEMGEGEVS